jgi:hypothetical protein
MRAFWLVKVSECQGFGVLELIKWIPRHSDTPTLWHLRVEYIRLFGVPQNRRLKR